MPGTPEYGHAFESIVMQEIRAYLGYTGSEEELTYNQIWCIRNELDTKSFARKLVELSGQR